MKIELTKRQSDIVRQSLELFVAYATDYNEDTDVAEELLEQIFFETPVEERQA